MKPEQFTAQQMIDTLTETKGKKTKCSNLEKAFKMKSFYEDGEGAFEFVNLIANNEYLPHSREEPS